MGRNGDFCVAVGPVTRPGGMLTYCTLTVAYSKVQGYLCVTTDL